MVSVTVCVWVLKNDWGCGLGVSVSRVCEDFRGSESVSPKDLWVFLRFFGNMTDGRGI